MPNDFVVKICKEPDKPPLFLFPDILGSGIETLWPKFQSGEIKRSLIINQYDQKYNYNSLDEHIDALCGQILNDREIAKTFTVEPFPFLLVGYSYGSTLASMVALRLKALGHDVHLVLIDNPSLETIQAYFKNQPLESSKLLVQVFNYAAKLSFPNEEKTLLCTNDTIAKLSKLDFGSRLTAIADMVLNYQNGDEDKIENFNMYADRAKQNLLNIYNYKSNNIPKIQVDNINLIVTEETKNRYSNNLGWESYAKNINLIMTPNDFTHANIIAQDNDRAQMVANTIQEVFTKEALPIQNAIEEEMRLVLTDVIKNNKQVTAKDISSILDRLSKVFQGQALTPSEDTMDCVSPTTSSNDDKNTIAMESEPMILCESGSSSPSPEITRKKTKVKPPYGGLWSTSSNSSSSDSDNSNKMNIDEEWGYNTRSKTRKKADKLNSPSSRSPYSSP